MSQITVFIDGVKCIAQKGQTILEIAAEAGIEIPTLCNDETVKPYGGCGLCVVEAEGSPKLLRSCATEVVDGQVIRTHSDRIDKVRKTTLELLMSDHEGDCRGPCSMRCPAGTDCQGYVKQIALGNDREAVRILKEKLPLPASIGRICPHPCENDCRRGMVERAISIAELKAFAADQDLKSGNPYRAPAAEKRTGKTVGVIGGGPAGLTAAYFLALKGHDVTIADAMPEMGGMLRYGIPEYRLPKKVLAAEINQIASYGVAMRNNLKLGRDIPFDAFRQQFDAVLIAAGAWKGRGVGCQGEELSGVFDGISFLRMVSKQETVEIGETVVVVGGGNTAMDACRTAVRLGAKRVCVVYRRSRSEMPAQQEEVDEALEEGVEFRFLTRPVEILGENGRTTAIRLQKMELGEPDEFGRRVPVPTDQFEVLPADSVIAAIGQSADVTAFSESGLAMVGGNIAADEMTCATNLPGVYAAGDITNRGAGIAIEAIAEAGKAAEAIDAYLRGVEASNRKPYVSVRQPDNAMRKTLAAREKIPRETAVRRSGEERRGDFLEISNGLTEAQARREAKRCLECGCHDYGECKLVRYADEYRVQPERLTGNKHSGFKEQRLEIIERDQGKCILCGLCVRICDENVGKGLLGLVGRGFHTVIKPEFLDSSAVADCVNCQKCALHCPTGALKMLAPEKIGKQSKAVAK